VLARAAQECGTRSAVFLGAGLPQALCDLVQAASADSSVSLAFIEVDALSPRGHVLNERPRPGDCRTVGLSTVGLDRWSELWGADSTGRPTIDRLICPFAVLDFSPASSPIVRELGRGLTASDLQRAVTFPLFAGPDLKEMT